MMNENNGALTQAITQFLCWLTATYSYLKGLNVSDWGVIIGVVMSALFGIYGAMQQRKRTKLAEERNRIIKERYLGRK